MKDKKSLMLALVAAITLIVIVLGATYAYFQAQTGTGTGANITVQTSTTDSLSFTKGSDINLTATLDTFGKTNGNVSGNTTVSATLIPNKASGSASATYYAFLDITTNTFEYTTTAKTAEILLKVTNPNNAEVTAISGLTRKSVTGVNGVTVTGFDITSYEGLINIAEGYTISTTNNVTVTQSWKVEVIFVNLNSDQEANTNKRFSSTINIQKTSPNKVKILSADVAGEGSYVYVTINETDQSFEYDRIYFSSDNINWTESSSTGFLWVDFMCPYGTEKTYYIYAVDAAGNSTEVYQGSVVTGCFVAGTQIWTVNGYKNIEDIEVGDEVYSYNEESQQIESNLVSKLYIHEDDNMYEIKIGNEIIKTTAYHRFYVRTKYDLNSGWIHAKDLTENDYIMNSFGVFEKIKEIITYNESNTVYNFEVENNRNYYVTNDNYLVHNAKEFCS